MSEHHSDLPPSSWPAILQCACYQSGEPGEAAIRGTMQHEYLEQLLSDSPQRDKCLCLEPDEREAVEWAAEYIRTQCGTQKPLIEQRVALLDDDFNEITFGKLDAFCGCDLFDYKSGQRHDYSAQMAAYALAMMQAKSLQYVHIHILYGRTKSAVEYIIKKDEAESFCAAVVARRRDPNRKPEPCDYCKWCKHVATCPAINERAVAVGKGRDDWQLANYHSSQITDPAEMAKALILARQLAGWCESVEHHAKEMVVKAGLPIPGFTLVERAGAREITDISKAFSAAALPQDKFLACCKAQIGKLEETYAEFHGMKKTAAKKAVNEKLAGCITQRASTKMLVTAKGGME